VGSGDSAVPWSTVRAAARRPWSAPVEGYPLREERTSGRLAERLVESDLTVRPRL
jgi:hypothetical protein